MKKSLAGVLLAGILLLTGCASADPSELALKACKDEAQEQLDADEYDWGDLKAADLSKDLYDAGIADEYDAESGKRTVAGEFVSRTGSVETRHSIVCMTEVVDGDVEFSVEPAITEP